MKKTFPNRFAATAFLLLPAGLMAQATGTSHPEDLNDVITATPAPAPHYVKPSPAVPMTAPEASTPAPVLVERVPPRTAPLNPAPQAFPATQCAAPVETAKASPRDAGLLVTEDPTSGVVMDVPSAVNELPAGSLLHTSLAGEVSTVVTERGASFTARLLRPVSRRGEVLLPTGSILSGRVAEIHAGSRMHGGAVIQLIPEAVSLPDGTRHRLQAQVIDLPSVEDAKVSDEGVIHGRSNVKATAAAVGLTTASATVAGAMVGGGVGAAVGATVGAGIATVWYFKHEQEQTLPEGTEIVFSLDRPLLLEPSGR